LNNGGLLIDTSPLRRFIHFDPERGIVRAEAGLSVAELLEVIAPRGWFIPVSPGTQFVTIAGALANDIHGKNHHRSGTFGCHVRRFELLRSDGTRRECSPDENAELFRATIGGMGLTGLVSWLEIQLKRIPGACVQLEQIRFRSFDEYLALETESSANYEYTVSWIDCLTSGSTRGLFQRANFSEVDAPRRRPLQLRAPVDLPSFLLNTITMKLFNTAIYHSQWRDHVSRISHYVPFFYPLDSVLDWNRVYGKSGFYQYQFVIPSDAQELFQEILQRIADSGQGSFLVVLKKFGEIRSPGMMSFPRAGFTLALDFPNRGQSTLALLDDLDQRVLEAGGAVYPAKDARMSADSFQSYYPQWKEFSRYMDPNFSSSFWRRVTAAAAP
jgi:FAD/FMN-containing dehydrogenase